MRSLLAILLLAPVAVAQDRPLPPESAAKAMTLPPGFKSTLFAGEPNVVQPIAFTFDDRGRLWVVECLSYPKWTSDGKGNDRVSIYEDSNGDGKFDKKTVFYDKGSNLSGIEYGFGGVWLCSTPNLIFIPDRDRDDKPDGPPQIVLDGWDLKAKHNVFNSLAWGPDGWLYGCNGILSNSKVGKPGTAPDKRVALDCGVWRYHPVKQVFEEFASGTTNPWGLDFNEEGEMFITNCVIKHIFHVVPGARFERMFGQDIHPNSYALMPSIADHIHWGGGDWTSSRGGKGLHDSPGGGHAHSGCMVYLGDNWPDEYRGDVFMCNIHGSRINRDKLRPRGSTYVASHAPDFMHANDPWFRGLVLKYGPDGGVFVADWTDTGECHNYDKADVTNGRIFKITYGTPKPWQGDLAKLSDVELVKLLRHKNDWFCQHARRLLQERAAAGRVDPKAMAEMRGMIDEKEEVRVRLRGLWALHSIRVQNGPYRQDRNEAFDRWAIRLKLTEGTEDAFSDVLPRDPFDTYSASAKLAIGGALQRCDLHPSLIALYVERLARACNEKDDQMIWLMNWYAMEPTIKAERNLSITRMATDLPNWVREFTARRIIETDIENLNEVLAYCVLFAQRSPARAKVMFPEIFRGILLALADRREVEMPKHWAVLSESIATLNSDVVNDQAMELSMKFGDSNAIVAAQRMLNDSNVPIPRRRFALRLLQQRSHPELFTMLKGLFDQDALRPDAIRGLATFADPSIPDLLLSRYAKFTDAEKADAIQTLASRPKFAMALLDAVEKKVVPARDITPFLARQIQGLKDPAVAKRLDQVWGVIRSPGQDRAKRMGELKSVLTKETLAKADMVRGKQMFAKTCASCHKLFDEGTAIAPELTGSQRSNLDYLLENILDPSAVVARDYQMHQIDLKNGRTVNGAIVQETPNAITVQMLNEKLVVLKSDIETQTPTRVSLMPDGLLDKLTNEELRDLFGYLMRK